MKHTCTWIALWLSACILISCTQPAPQRSPFAPIPSLAPLRSATPTTAPQSNQPPAPTKLQPTTLQTSPTLAATLAPKPWRFVVLGDTRTAGLDPPAITAQIVERASTAKPAITLAVGDLINALDDQASVQTQWQRWRATVEPLGQATNSTPWLLPTPGNHDVQGHNWATNLMATAFPELPENGPADLAHLAYRYDYQGVRFISVHSEIFGDPHRLGDTQLVWLEQQLINNPNRYTIVFSHDPAFPIGPHVGSAMDAYPSERDRFWALLKQYHVTAYICGHEHLYNRQLIDGVTQLVVGTSGSAPYGGFGGDFYHYLVAEVGQAGIAMVVYDSTGAERDRFLLP